MSSAQCPICSNPAQAKHRPFCSARCSDVDLHRWLTNGYVVAAAEEDGSLPEAEVED